MASILVPAATGTGGYGCRSRFRVIDPRCATPGNPQGLNRQQHQGVDIVAPEGSRINAPLDGVVGAVFANGALSRYGNLLILHHQLPDARAWTGYAHMHDPPAREDGSPLRVGDHVFASEQIGRVGKTGACSSRTRGRSCTDNGPYLLGGAHLHHEAGPGWATRLSPQSPARFNPYTFSRAQGYSLRDVARGTDERIASIALYDTAGELDPDDGDLGDESGPAGFWRGVAWGIVALAAGALGIHFVNRR